MRALFLQHDPGSRPGLLGEALEARGAELELLPMAASIDDASWDDAFPAPGSHDLVVPLGAIWSVYDIRRLPWVDRELDWLRALDDQGTPVLGVCFGGQALAAAHGGSVEPMGRMDIGWSTVDVDRPDAVPTGPWMQWHGDRFTPPADAEVLARTGVGAQAFTLRANLALQFHPEVTDEILATWLTLGGEAAEDAVRHAGWTPEGLLAAAVRERPRLRRDLDVLLNWWLPQVGLA